jgi:M6 family metalloprotease-like protein
VLFVVGFAFIFSSFLVATPSSGSPIKIGSRCNQVGKLVTQGGKTFICTKKNVKQTWLASTKLKNGGKCLHRKQWARTAAGKFTCTKVGKKLLWVFTETVTKLPEISPDSDFRDDTYCRLQQTYQNYFLTGFGFPRSDTRLKNTGDVRGIVLYVEFSDVNGTDDPISDAATYVPQFEQYYNANSYGNMNLKMDVYPQYLKINRNSGFYKMDTWGGGDPYAYWEDALSAADPFVDFSPYELVVVMPPSGISKIIYGPSFPMPPTSLVGKTDEKTIYNGVAGGSDQRNRSTRWIWLAHEVGHNFGMEHQFNFDSEAVWDLMNNVYFATAPELFGWHRFLQGWMSDTKVKCLDRNDLENADVTVLLEPLVTMSNGSKITIVRIDDQRALVIEVRRALGTDTLDGNNQFEGAIVYTVDVSKQSNQGAISMVIPSSQRSTNGRIVGNLRENEFVVFDGIRVNVLKSTSQGDYIKLSR